MKMVEEVRIEGMPKGRIRVSFQYNPAYISKIGMICEIGSDMKELCAIGIKNYRKGL